MRKTAMAIPLILMTACSSLAFASDTASSATTAPYNAKLENTPEQHQQPKVRRDARSAWIEKDAQEQSKRAQDQHAQHQSATQQTASQ